MYLESPLACKNTKRYPLPHTLRASLYLSVTQHLPGLYHSQGSNFWGEWNNRFNAIIAYCMALHRVLMKVIKPLNKRSFSTWNLMAPVTLTYIRIVIPIQRNSTFNLTSLESRKKGIRRAPAGNRQSKFPKPWNCLELNANFFDILLKKISCYVTLGGSSL